MYIVHCQLVTIAMGLLFFLIKDFPLCHLLHLVIIIWAEFQTSLFPGCCFFSCVFLFVVAVFWLFVVVFWLQLFLTVHFAHAYGVLLAFYFSLYNFAPDGSSTVFYSFTCTYNHEISCMDSILILDVWAMLAWLFVLVLCHTWHAWLFVVCVNFSSWPAVQSILTLKK